MAPSKSKAADSDNKVARIELLRWTSDTLAVDLQTIKQVQNGAVYCQLFHILHKDAIDMAQVNFAAQTEFECLANYRLLQRAHNDMTRTKLLDWWKIVSDEEKAWDLLAAMCQAVKGSEALSSYCPLEAKCESKGRKLSAPLEPYMIQAPLTPSSGLGLKKSVEPDAYFRGSKPLSPKAPKGYPLFAASSLQNDEASHLQTSTNHAMERSRSGGIRPQSATSTFSLTTKSLIGNEMVAPATPEKPSLLRPSTWRLAQASSQGQGEGGNVPHGPAGDANTDAAQRGPGQGPASGLSCAKAALKLQWLGGQHQHRSQENEDLPPPPSKTWKAGTEGSEAKSSPTAGRAQQTICLPDACQGGTEAKPEPPSSIAQRLGWLQRECADVAHDKWAASALEKSSAGAGKQNPNSISRSGWTNMWPKSYSREGPTESSKERGQEAADAEGGDEKAGQPDAANQPDLYPEGLPTTGKWLFSHPAETSASVKAAVETEPAAAALANAEKKESTSPGSVKAVPLGLGSSALGLCRANQRSRANMKASAVSSKYDHAKEAAVAADDSPARGLFSKGSWKLQWPTKAVQNGTTQVIQGEMNGGRRPQVMVLEVGPNGVRSRQLQALTGLKPAMVDAFTQTELMSASNDGAGHPSSDEVLADTLAEGKPVSTTQGRIIAPPEEDDAIAEHEALGENGHAKSCIPLDSLERRTASTPLGPDQEDMSTTATRDVASGPCVGVPYNLRNASFRGETPKEPVYALEPVTPRSLTGALPNQAIRALNGHSNQAEKVEQHRNSKAFGSPLRMPLIQTAASTAPPQATAPEPAGKKPPLSDNDTVAKAAAHPDSSAVEVVEGQSSSTSGSRPTVEKPKKFGAASAWAKFEGMSKEHDAVPEQLAPNSAALWRGPVKPKANSPAAKNKETAGPRARADAQTAAEAVEEHGSGPVSASSPVTESQDGKAHDALPDDALSPKHGSTEWDRSLGAQSNKLDTTSGQLGQSFSPALNSAPVSLLTAPELNTKAESLPTLLPHPEPAADQHFERQWRKETNDASAWAGLDSAVAEAAENAEPKKADGASPRAMDTQEKPTKVSSDSALWKERAASRASEAAKPGLQAVGVHDFWEKQNSLESQPKLDPGLISGSITASDRITEAKINNPAGGHKGVKQADQMAEEHPKPVAAAAEESWNKQEEAPAAMLGAPTSGLDQIQAAAKSQSAVEMPAALPTASAEGSKASKPDDSEAGKDRAGSGVAAIARKFEPPAEQAGMQNSLAGPHESAGKKSGSGVAVPGASCASAARGFWGEQVAGETATSPHNSVSTARAETSTPILPGVASARSYWQRHASENDAGAYISNGKVSPEKMPPAAQRVWARMVASIQKDDDSQKVEHEAAKAATEAKPKSHAKWAKGFTALKVEGKGKDKPKEAAAKSQEVGAKPRGPRVLSRLVSEKMSNAEQLLGRKGVIGKLDAIREKYETRTASRDLSASNLSRRASETMDGKQSEDSSFTSSHSRPSAPGLEAPETAFTFKRPSRRTARESSILFQEGERKPSSQPQPDGAVATAAELPGEMAKGTPKLTSHEQILSMPLTAVADMEPEGAGSDSNSTPHKEPISNGDTVDSKQAGSALKADEDEASLPASVFTTGPALKAALLKQLSSGPQETSTGETATKPGSSQVETPIKSQSRNAGAFADGLTSKTAPLTELSEEGTNLSNEKAPESTSKDHVTAAPGQKAQIATGLALKAALLKQASQGDIPDPQRRVSGQQEMAQPEAVPASPITRGLDLKAALIKQASSGGLDAQTPKQGLPTRTSATSTESGTIEDTRQPVRRRLTANLGLSSQQPPTLAVASPTFAPSKVSPVPDKPSSPGIGQYVTASSLKSALVRQASSERQVQAPALANGIGRYATASSLKNALVKQAAMPEATALPPPSGKPAPPHGRGAAKANSDSIQAAMNRAMQRRASLRKTGSFKPAALGEEKSRVKAPPDEDNLAVRSIINASLDATIHENEPGLPPDSRSQTVPSDPNSSLRDKYNPAPANNLTVRVREPPEVPQKGKKKGLHLPGLDRASSSVSEGIKKSALKNKLWAFGKGRAAAH